MAITRNERRMERKPMGKTVVTFQDVIDLNQLLRERDLKCKVHLHDACGGQKFTLELLADVQSETSADAELYATIKETITQFFDQKQLTIQFVENDMEFYVL